MPTPSHPSRRLATAGALALLTLAAPAVAVDGLHDPGFGSSGVLGRLAGYLFLLVAARVNLLVSRYFVVAPASCKTMPPSTPRAARSCSRSPAIR